MKAKKFYLAAAVCLTAGAVFAVAGFAAGGRPGVVAGLDGIRLTGGGAYDDYILEKTPLEEFASVEISLEYADFELAPADDFYLEYQIDGSGRKPEYGVKDGVFTFSEREASNFIQMHFLDFNRSPGHRQYKVTLYVPEDAGFERFKLESGSGDVSLGELRAKEAELSVEYGDLSADAVEGDQVKLEVENGGITAGEVTGREALEVELEYGDLEADAASGAEVSVKNQSGNVDLKKLQSDGQAELTMEYGDLTIQEAAANRLFVENNSGDVRIDSLTPGSDSILELEYGNAEVGVTGGIDSCTMNLYTEYGSINAPKSGMHLSDDDAESFRTEGDSSRKLEITCESGDITVRNAEK